MKMTKNIVGSRIGIPIEKYQKCYILDGKKVM
jgi:hypothetical protein